MKKYLERRRLDSIGSKYRYEYLVECSCIAYQLIQAKLIEYNRETNSYNLGRALQKCIALNPVNSGNILTDDAEDNPEPTQSKTGRCNDYPKGEYIRSLMEAQDI